MKRSLLLLFLSASIHAHDLTTLPQVEAIGERPNRTALKYVKPVYAFSPSTLKPGGAKFEIVPQAAPANGQLPVQLRFDGQPLSGAVLTISDTNVTADAQGRATLPHQCQALYTTRHEQAGGDGADGEGLYRSTRAML